MLIMKNTCHKLSENTGSIPSHLGVAIFDDYKKPIIKNIKKNYHPENFKVTFFPESWNFFYNLY
jgi:hypothetical protein